MFMRRPIYEGDSLIHAAPGNEADAGKTPETERPDSSPEVSKRRSEALRGFFPKLAVWLDNRIHFARMREIERYLSAATDPVDLERRIAEIDRGARRH
jgi:hypothetical protein